MEEATRWGTLEQLRDLKINDTNDADGHGTRTIEIKLHDPFKAGDKLMRARGAYQSGDDVQVNVGIQSNSNVFSGL